MRLIFAQVPVMWESVFYFAHDLTNNRWLGEQAFTTMEAASLEAKLLTTEERIVVGMPIPVILPSSLYAPKEDYYVTLLFNEDNLILEAIASETDISQNVNALNFLFAPKSAETSSLSAIDHIKVFKVPVN